MERESAPAISVADPAPAAERSARAAPDEPKLRLGEVHIVPLGADRVQIRGPHQAVAVRGLVVRDVFPRLLPLLDGSLRRSEIIAALQPDFDAHRIARVLDALRGRKLVKAVEPPPPGLIPEQGAGHYEMLARIFERHGGRYSALAAARAAHVAVIGRAPMAAKLAASLAGFGFGGISIVGAQAPGDADCNGSATANGGRLRSIPEMPAQRDGWEELLAGVDAAAVLVNGPILFYPWLENFNAAALACRVPWISSAIVDGADLHIGPAVTPGVTACYKCFEMRFKSNVAFLEAYCAFESFVRECDAPDYACLPPLSDIAASLTALELVRLVDPEQTPRTSGALLTFDSRDYATALHPVLKIPRCPACCKSSGRPRPRIWS